MYVIPNIELRTFFAAGDPIGIQTTQNMMGPGGLTLLYSTPLGELNKAIVSEIFSKCNGGKGWQP